MRVSLLVPILSVAISFVPLDSAEPLSFSASVKSKRCSYGFTKCYGGCVNLKKDKKNCGRCGNKCSSSKKCYKGNCRKKCLTDANCTPKDACHTVECKYGVCFQHKIDGCGTCTADSQCEDNNACTTDDCGTGGVCTHVAVEGCCNQNSDCNDNDPCTTDTCSNHVCTNAPIADCKTCEADVDCDDENICTEDRCRNNGTCQYNASDGNTCDRGNVLANPDGECSGKVCACDPTLNDATTGLNLFCGHNGTCTQNRRCKCGTTAACTKGLHCSAASVCAT